MSFAYLALFTGDYLRDTRHLTPEEHGCYLLLLMYCWDQKGPVPLDERKQAGIVNARSGGELESLRRILGEFFVKMEDGWYNPRMEKEVEKVSQLSRLWSEAGKRGAVIRHQTKAKGRLRVGQAEATTPSSSSSSSLSLQSSNTLSGKPNDAVEVLNFLNSKTGKAYRATKSNLDLILARFKDGASVQDCKQVIARKVMDWLHDDKMRDYLRPATLFNRTKFDQYTGELVL